MSLDMARQTKGQQIFDKQGQIERTDQTTYRVSSQSGHGFYRVIHATYGGGLGLKCSCPDHTNRSVKCKHIWAVEFSLALRTQVQVHRNEAATQIGAVNVSSCRFCGSSQIVRDGVWHNRAGNIQFYLCQDCGRHFSFNLGFEHMRASPQAITSAMQLYFTGESLRNVQKFLRLQGVNVSHVALLQVDNEVC
jgi:transposase-like protein